MNRKLVSFEMAKKLKEKGFEEPTIMRYDSEGGLPDIVVDGEFYRAPEIVHVLDWLRDKKKLLVFVLPDNYLRNLYGYEIFDIEEWDYEGTTGRYKSYEEAILAGIERVLDKLI